MGIHISYAIFHTLLYGIYILFTFTTPQFTVKFTQPGLDQKTPFTVQCGSYSAVAIDTGGNVQCRVNAFGEACQKISDKINELDGQTCGNTPGYVSFGKMLIVYLQQMDIDVTIITSSSGLALIVIWILILAPNRWKSASLTTVKLLHTLSGLFCIILTSQAFNAMNESQFEGNADVGQKVHMGPALLTTIVTVFSTLVSIVI